MSYLVFGLHYIAFAVGLGCLFIQLTFLTIKDLEPKTRVLFLSRVDALFGFAALLTLVTGLMRVFLFGKGPGFYFLHPIFWLKMGLFAGIGLCSILPTVYFLKHRTLSILDWRKNRPEQIVWALLMIRIEIVVYLLIPFVAAALAHGPHDLL